VNTTVTKQTVLVTDPLQKGYSYTCTEPEGSNFAPDFSPDLTPREMLELGVFGGDYFEGEIDEYPVSWFTQAKLSTPGKYDKNINYFGVRASQSRSEWARKGWLYVDDPRGWFQWYCRYYLGRRIPQEDARQIARWKNIVRHISQIKLHCRQGDKTCRPRQRQAVLHWSYNSTQM
jgi:hypothetical protein